ncbi:UBP-type zinc finger domain-containing protein [Aquabacterium sp. A7-Y]|uniref:UBP-type zinc finger domain-containing protein n=1 Tax=Aquabacterium sp. A7-Y TaxID=1349605 RepID=UPI00223D6D4E|nr:UBP-type zinc finger domain-containing protein [Aquabacterium sp. A7-Y]MCW7541099.1 UBP-type zinc finger domain-containing protein [Aquabacterium sp. A7-Y]
MATVCRHLDQIVVTTTDTGVCEDCVKLGDDWVHLRLCMSCGHVGCCDSSKNRHARRHFQHTGHPLVRSIWCYADEVMPGELAE